MKQKIQRMFSGSIQSADYESERKLKRKRIYLFPHALDVSIFQFLSISSDLQIRSKRLKTT
jgi:hypothetical protein